jgi:hypothetical protein
LIEAGDFDFPVSANCRVAVFAHDLIISLHTTYGIVSIIK